MKQLDSKSRAFINWSISQLKHKEQLRELLMDIQVDLLMYYEQSLKKTHLALREKMYKGALEHGEPKQDPEQITKEIEMEFIDLLGWELMRRYAQKGDK